MFVAAACGGPAKPAPEKPVKQPDVVTPPPKAKTAAEQFMEQCHDDVVAARTLGPLRPRIRNWPGRRPATEDGPS